MDKKSLRKEMAVLRNSLDEKQITQRSKKIFDNLKSMSEFLNADNILNFMSIRSEVDTGFITEFCFENNKKIAAPKVENDKMNFYFITSSKDLVKGYMGIKEPVTRDIYEPVSEKLIKSGEVVSRKEKNGDVVIMPGLAFSRDGQRLGYGGGFYDKFLAEHPNLIKIAVAYDFQIRDDIVSEEYDIKPDFIVTENEIIEINLNHMECR